MEKGLTDIQRIKKYLGNNNEDDYIVGYTLENELGDLKNKDSISVYNLISIRKSYPYIKNKVIKRVRIKIDSVDLVSVFSQIFFEKTQEVKGLVFVEGENITISGYTVKTNGDNIQIDGDLILPWRKEI